LLFVRDISRMKAWRKPACKCDVYHRICIVFRQSLSLHWRLFIFNG